MIATFSVMEQVTEQLQNEQQATWDFPLEGPVSGVNHPGINWQWGKMFIIIPNKRPNVSKACAKNIPGLRCSLVGHCGTLFFSLSSWLW